MIQILNVDSQSIPWESTLYQWCWCCKRRPL